MQIHYKLMFVIALTLQKKYCCMATIKNETNKQKRTALDRSFLVFTKDLKNAVWYVARIATCKG